MKLRSLPESRATAMPLFPFRNPITEAVLGGNCDTHVHVVRHQVPFYDLPLLLLCQSVEDGTQLAAQPHKQHLAPTLGYEHDICSPISNGIGSDTGLTSHPPSG